MPGCPPQPDLCAAICGILSWCELLTRAESPMTLIHNDPPLPYPNDPIIDWLLDADPSIRWQVMRDLTDTPVEIVAAERSRIASEGWGLRLLDQQRPDGQWGDGVGTPFWWSNMYTAFPTLWHYDVLRALDYLRAAD